MGLSASRLAGGIAVCGILACRNHPPTIDELGISATGGCAFGSTAGLYCWGDASHVVAKKVPGRRIDEIAGGEILCVRESTKVSCGGPFGGVAKVAPAALKIRVVGQKIYRLSDGGLVHSDGEETLGVSNVIDFQVGKLGLLALHSDGHVGFVPSPLDSKSAERTVAGFGNAVSLAVGDDHACVVLRDETVWCFGSNAEGQLGNGTTTSSELPVQVNNVGGAVQVVADSAFSCARLRDGTVSCWGHNGHFETRSTREDSPSLAPEPIIGLFGVRKIVAKSHGICAVLGPDEGVRCWGHGPASRFAQRAVGDVRVPMPVLFPKK